MKKIILQKFTHLVLVGILLCLCNFAAGQRPVKKAVQEANTADNSLKKENVDFTNDDIKEFLGNDYKSKAEMKDNANKLTVINSWTDSDEAMKSITLTATELTRKTTAFQTALNKATTKGEAYSLIQSLAKSYQSASNDLVKAESSKLNFSEKERESIQTYKNNYAKTLALLKTMADNNK